MRARSLVLLAMALVAGPAAAQEVLRLYPGPAPGSEAWTHEEQQYHSKIWNTEVVTNVVEPTLTVYLPKEGQSTGTAVIVAPGGGFHALSIQSEGIQVAKWLVERGVAAFVLKYRLVPTEGEAVAEMQEKSSKPEELRSSFQTILPMVVADGQAAVRLIRSKAEEYGLAPDRLGLMGFSAGGAVAVGVVFADEPSSRPDFVAPIYPGGTFFEEKLPDDPPPAFFLAATDDQLDLAKDSVALYSAWLAAGESAELHLYAKGGHGFGMREQGLPSDRWIELFGDWLNAQGLVER